MYVGYVVILGITSKTAPWGEAILGQYSYFNQINNLKIRILKIKYIIFFLKCNKLH
jgi:hypothetical protein